MNHIVLYISRAVLILVLLPLMSCNKQSDCIKALENQQYEAAASSCTTRLETDGDVKYAEALIEALNNLARIEEIDPVINRLNDASVRAEVMLAAAPSAWRSGNKELSERYYRQSEEIFDDLALHPQQMKALDGLFYLAWQRSAHREALGYASSALEIARQSGDRNNEMVALNNLFNIFEEVGSVGPAQQALSLIDKRLAGDDSSPRRINAYISQGLLDMSSKNFNMAEFHFQAALKAAAGSKNHSALRGLHLNLVHANMELGRMEEAQRHMDIAWGYANPDGSVRFALLYYQSLMHFHYDDYSQAYETMMQALATPDLPEVWTWEMHYWAGKAAHAMGERSKAIDSYKNAIAASENLREKIGLDRLKAHLLSRKPGTL